MARADRRRVPRPRADARGPGRAAPASRARVADDGLFFSRIRKQARWFFAILAVLFAASTALLGVGTGFGGLQDVFLQQGPTGGPSESDARERIEANPNDAQAHRDLAEALQLNGKIDESIQPLNRYVQLRPNDIEAKRELAGLLLRRAEQQRAEAQAAQYALQQEVPGQIFQPDPTSTVGQAVGSDELSQALAARHTERLNRAIAAMSETYRRAVTIYKQIAEAQPNDAAVQFELAQTAEAANDVPTALAAYKRFLELAPEDRTAEAVEQRVAQLEGAGGEDGDG